MNGRSTTGPGALGRLVAAIAAVVVLAALAAQAHAQDDARPAPPDAAARRQIEQQVRQALAPRYEDRSPGGPKALVAALMEQGAAESNPADMRYVLLDEARATALREGMFAETMAAIAELEAGWRVDGFAMRLETVESFGRRLRDANEAVAWVEAAVGVIGQALERDDAVAAGRLLSSASRTAGRLTDPVAIATLKPQIDDLNDRLKAHRAYQLHAARLERNADDPLANTVVGKHLCLVRGDWLKGLRMLAKGNDPALRELAAIELKPEKSVDEMVSLTEGWLSQAKSERGVMRDGMLRRVAYWCEQAEPHVTGLRLAAIKQRHAEAYRLAGLPGGYAKLTEQERARLVRYGKKWFLFVNERTPRDAAVAWCKERGATLPSIHSAQENQFLINLARKHEPAIDAFWAGGSDVDEEGNWKWDDGTPFRYTNWHRGEPSNHGGIEHWVLVLTGETWNDVPKGGAHRFFAQWIME